MSPRIPHPPLNCRPPTPAGQRVLVVGHGGVLSALFIHASGGAFQGGPVRNASISVLRVEGKDWVLTR